MKMLFLRDFRGLTGGHLKYLHYMLHTATFDNIQPELFLAGTSLMDDSNPFLTAGVPLPNELRPSDSYFIAGTDWGLLNAAGIDPGEKPVINLVQGFSHTDPGDPKFAYLSRPALRICVSAEVEEALHATGIVAGEIKTIENGIDVGVLQAGPRMQERSGVFVAGYKSPECGRMIAERLRGIAIVDLADTFTARNDFLERIGRARLCVLLPGLKEGFYLPALEAMALGTAVIVPDCIGNRTFCLHRHTCLMPPYAVDEIVCSVRELIEDEVLLATLTAGGRAMAARHTIDRERDRYKAVLSDYLNGQRGFS